MTPLRVGLIGLGTVGGGVATILRSRPEQIARRAGRPVQIQRAAVRDLHKPRNIPLPTEVLTNDPFVVARHPEVDVVVELMGGIDPAREVVEAALEAGKHVVTANKALLCHHGRELFARARTLDRSIAFEAAVAGGVPIIEVLGQAMSANQITGIEAILNGTSNFILTEMLSRKEPYECALQEAQARGFAEADPSMDVDGTDAAQKLCLLTQLAFGTRVTPDQFLRQGIDTLELADLKYADELGYAVKLLATTKLVAKENPARSELEMHTQPTLIRHSRPIAQVDGPYNMIALVGDYVGPTWYLGPGAGALPTASAVVSDLISIAIGRAQLTFPRLDLWGETPGLPIQSADDILRRYYLRFNVEDKPHVMADITDILGRYGISLASVIQHEAPELDEDDDLSAPLVPLVLMTHRTREGALRRAIHDLDRLDSLRPPRVCMPVSD